jgi:hypothetical protein
MLSWRTHHRVLWLGPAAMAALGVLSLPYGYYQLLRLVMCGSCAYLAYASSQVTPRWTIWPFVLGFIALLFNPIIPIHLTKAAWQIIDPAVAAVLVAHMALARGWRDPVAATTND